MSSLLVFLFVWGVYLITPVMIDGADAIGRLGVVLAERITRHKSPEPEEPDDWPIISIIVPAHNESAVIDRCLASVKCQDYPSHRLEIIVVDDGSTDDTASRVDSHVNGGGEARPFVVRRQRIQVGPFAGKLALIRNARGGKSTALNAGIAESTGEIIVNIDSDVVLTRDAVRQIALAFIRNPRLDAATGNIHVDWDLIEARDTDGNIVVDVKGVIVPRRLGVFERFLAKCQFLEYLASFDLGRRSQAITSTMYTVAGACTAFRRDVIASGLRYSSATVSEDTALTFELHRMGARIGFMPEVNVHLEPVTDLDTLYSQRVRWSRGQLEVCGINKDLIGRRDNSLGRLALPQMLMYDHTFAFPRLVWAPLFLAFPLLGYSVQTIVMACVAMYGFYCVIELIHSFTSYAVADEYTKARVGQCRWTILAMPLYRLIVFHYRFSGFLVALKDEQSWSASGPVETARRDLRALRSLRVTPALWSGMTRVAKRLDGLDGLPFFAFALGLFYRLAEILRHPRS
jgi:biofilm PGA synthesis N-glycosyltransferase PgaC